jgi:DNA-binding CsgD family transcriptional regulator
MRHEVPNGRDNLDQPRVHGFGSTRSDFALLHDDPPVVDVPLANGSLPLPSALTALITATPVERRLLIESLLRWMGFDWLTYGRVKLIRGGPVPTSFCVAHGKPEWTKRYLACRYYAIDPRLQGALRSALPYAWDVEELLRSAPGTAEGANVRAFLHELRDAGLCSGVMFAVTGPQHPDERSIISLGSRAAESPCAKHALLCQVLMLGMCVHEFYSRYTHWPSDDSGTRAKLSPTQERVLQCLACGLIDREIASALGLTMHGVDYHLRQLRKRFNARNRVELVQLATHTHFT